MIFDDEFPAHMRKLLPAVMAQFQPKEPMSNNTFAHAVWGIDLDAYAALIESPQLLLLNQQLRRARKAQDEDDNIDDAEGDAIVVKILPLLWLREDNTVRTYIVEEETDRGSETEAGTLLLGYGLCAFPFNVAERTEFYRQGNIQTLNGLGARWHTWVT